MFLCFLFQLLCVCVFQILTFVFGGCFVCLVLVCFFVCCLFVCLFLFVVPFLFFVCFVRFFMFYGLFCYILGLLFCCVCAVNGSKLLSLFWVLLLFLFDVVVCVFACLFLCFCCCVLCVFRSYFVYGLFCFIVGFVVACVRVFKNTCSDALCLFCFVCCLSWCVVCLHVCVCVPFFCDLFASFVFVEWIVLCSVLCCLCMLCF